MEIKYSKKRLRFNLILGIFWLAFTIVQVVSAKSNFWLIAWLVLGTLNFIQFAYRYFTPYLTLKEGVLVIHEFLGKSSIILSESTQIREFRGDYLVKDDSIKLTIRPQLIEPTSLTALKAELNKLNIKWDN